MAGTDLPDINKDPDWQIRKKGCAAIVALQIAGIPTNDTISGINARIDQTDANLEQTDANLQVTDATIAALAAATGQSIAAINIVIAQILATSTSGTVTSVGVSVPSVLTVSGTPVTTAGTITIGLAAQPANKVFAGPASGVDAVPTFRQAIPGDIALPTDKVLIGVAGNAAAIQTNVYNIVAYGADTTGVADSYPAIQAAVQAAEVAGGTVWIPTGTYKLTQAVLFAASTGVKVLGAGAGSVIKANASTLGAMLTITGENVGLDNFTIDGNYTSGVSSVDMGLVSISNAIDITVKSCWIKNSRRAGVRIYGDAWRISISDCTLSNNYVSIRSFPDQANVKANHQITIKNNTLINNWDTSGNDQTGGIKLENAGVSVNSEGHLIDGNYISNVGLLAIELWTGEAGIFRDSVVSNNRIYGSNSGQFGISFNGCWGCSAIGNSVRLTAGFIGIEVANECQRCLVSDNQIDMHGGNGTSTSSGTGIGVYHNNGYAPKFTKITNNIITGSDDGIHTQNTATTTTISDNKIRDCSGNLLVLQGSSYIVAHNNTFEGNCTAQLVIFGDYSSITSIDIGYNTFNGSAAYKNIWGYNNGTAFTITNFHFHHNDGTDNSFSGYNSWDMGWDAAEMINCRREDNYYKSGANKADWPYWTSADVPTPPFAAAQQEFSIPIASKFTFTVAANAGDQWFKIFRRVEGYPFLVAFHAECNFLSGDNVGSSQTFMVSAAPYGQGCNVMKFPDSPLNGGKIKEVIIDNSDGSVAQEIWLRIPATAGGTVTVGGADYASNWIIAPSAVTTEPSWNANSQKLNVADDHGAVKNTTMAANIITGSEQASSPAAPPSNGFRIFAKDNGAGKTAIYARFATGADQQIAIEP